MTSSLGVPPPTFLTTYLPTSVFWHSSSQNHPPGGFLKSPWHVRWYYVHGKFSSKKVKDEWHACHSQQMTQLVMCWLGPEARGRAKPGQKVGLGQTPTQSWDTHL